MRVFITGTNTEVGKTYVSCELLRWFQRQSYHTVGLKPIASGCERAPNGLFRNSDAMQLMAAATEKLSYHMINPFSFEPAIAPHIAAAQSAVSLTASNVAAAIEAGLNNSADITLIEGAGGWQLPLNHHEYLSDVIATLKIPVICVVGMTLGCLNHAILTCEAIGRQTQLLGWVANCIDPAMDALQENIISLEQHIKAPCLAVVPYHSDKTSVAPVQFDIDCTHYLVT